MKVSKLKTTKKETATQEALFDIGVSVSIIIVTAFTCIWEAYVGVMLWTWFLTPIFNIHAPTLWLMYGFLMTVRYAFAPLFRHLIDTDKEPVIPGKFGKALEATLVSIIQPTYFFVIGWVVAHLLV